MKKLIILFILIFLSFKNLIAQVIPIEQLPGKNPNMKLIKKKHTPSNKILRSLDILNIPVVYVKGGSYEMGSNNEYDRAKPIHHVTLNSFYMGKYEVSQAIWRFIMRNNPSYHKGCDDCPVEQVSWDDVQSFIEKLNQKTGKYYRLPTEAEWEYAARGGIRSNGYTFSGSDNISKVAWYKNNSGGKTHPCGQKQANELGIYDMTGNVWEWCSDWLGYDYYSNSPSENPRGPSTGECRVYRGGCWNFDPQDSHLANRSCYSPDQPGMGFRLVLIP